MISTGESECVTNRGYTSNRNGYYECISFNATVNGSRSR